MPHSAEEGRPWLRQRLAQLAPASMLDVGCGAGAYADLFQTYFPEAYRIGVEVWWPYVDRFQLGAKYNVLIVQDVREIDPLPEADVVILGDVLEHMSEQDALTVWNRARGAARKAVYLSIPIIHYPQGPEEGNPFETHIVDDYTHDTVLAQFDGITDWWTGEIVGVYEAAC